MNKIGEGMAFIRNNIEIEGIQQSGGILENAYILNYFENGTIFVPKGKGKIKYLNKVIIKIDSIEGRIINTPGGKVLSIYGRKIYSLIYSEKSHDRAQKADLNLPLIAYVYLPPEVEDFCNLEVSVLDAFFEVIDNRKIHNHILYLIKFDKKESLENKVKQNETENIQGQLTLSDLEKMLLASPLKDVLKNSNLLQGEKTEGLAKITSGQDDKNLLESENNKDVKKDKGIENIDSAKGGE